MSRTPIDRFEDEWKQWADRPPETSPEEAARQVLGRLGNEHRSAYVSAGLRWLAAAAVAGLVFGVWHLAPPRPPEAPSAFDAVPPVLDEGVVLIWLDSETPLYMTWNPPDAEQGDAP